ncbi:MAG: hypothetical protein CMP98_11295 [Gammaproteobacteria bacterium]|nr:hypothetical protein [Gammaproteobacteria bacterium]OUU08026.1 MAG: hypothetical protein CBB94_11535 [Gammaproteobacteria bacterium TMED34]
MITSSIWSMASPLRYRLYRNPLVAIRGRRSYKAGLARFVWFIAKIFLVDMQDLEGLLRIASFLGLGMASLGVCYLHRRSQNDEPLAESEASV